MMINTIQESGFIYHLQVKIIMNNYLFGNLKDEYYITFLIERSQTSKNE
jgi:hypothetical protein